MSNPIDLRVSHGVSLLEDLTSTVKEFAEREQQTLNYFQKQRHALNRRRSDELARIEHAAQTRTDSLEAGHAAEVATLQQRHERRADRIRRAQTNCLRTVTADATRAKERWLSALQKRHYEAKKTLPIRVKAADKELTDFGEKLQTRADALTALRDRAARYFSGYVSFVTRLHTTPEQPAAEPPPGSERDALYSRFDTAASDAESQLAAFRRRPVPLLFSMLPLVLLLVLIVIGAGVLAAFLGFNADAFRRAGLIAAVAAVGAVLLHAIGHAASKSAAVAIAEKLHEAARLHALSAEAAQALNRDQRAAAQADYEAVSSEVQQDWKKADDIEHDYSRDARVKINTQAPRLLARSDQKLKAQLAALSAAHTDALAAVKQQADEQSAKVGDVREDEILQITADEQAVWGALETEWTGRISRLYSEVHLLSGEATPPAWTRDFVASWTPPTAFTRGARFGRLDLDFSGHTQPSPKKLPFPGSTHVSIPLSLAFPEEGSLLFETRETAGVVATPLNNLLLRLLTTFPPGKLSLTILDPVGLGQNFAGLMHLGDYEESLISRRIWTQRDQIDDRLTELNEHIEKVIQMYLRNEYATITEYNAQAGSVAEKYHFLVVADFPSGFSEMAARRLQSIAVSGPRCGVFTLIHWDQRQTLPDGVVPEDLRHSSICLHREDERWTLTPAQAHSGAALVLDPPPEPELALELIHRIGKSSIDSNRVEVPFAHITPPAADFWKLETTSELRIPIGRTGATKLQYLAIGKGTRQHALFAGKTGSGKSTLFHVIITNLALACSPAEVEFYLIDFKKGVEFKCYASHRLPHARVVAIESDREFGLSVLQRVDEELKRRGDLFRRLGVQDIPGYKRAGGTEPMPRSLLLIDEFQEFFTEDDDVAQTASVLLDRIVRQGRAFGIHVLLGSQTLGGAYTLARATLGQMVIRVALQCNEADAYLIMDDNNSAPRLLSRPGEGIYNDAAGAVEGNSPFQVVWLPDEERDTWLDRVDALAAQHPRIFDSPVVFEGNAPAEIRENDLLARALATRPTVVPNTGRVWLGAPNSIKGPTEAVFQRQSGSHLLIVGQREEASLASIGLALFALSAQYPETAARFVLIHNSVPGSPDALFLDRIVAAIPHPVAVGNALNLAEVMGEVGQDLAQRLSGDAAPDAPSVFVLIHGLQRFKKLRAEDEFDFSGSSETGPGTHLTNLIVEGAALGLHLITTLDSYNNVGRFLSRKSLSEIEMRVLYQMSANDSASLIDSPKASTLGLYRALLYNEQRGTLETFRPYALPPTAWLDTALPHLRPTVPE